MDVDRRVFCQSLLAFGLAGGLISHPDYAAAKTAVAAEDVEFFLARGIEFFDHPPISSIRNADVPRLLDAFVKVPEWLNEGLELTHPNGEKRRVRTCRQYRLAIADGYFAYSTFDMKMTYWFDIPNGMLLAAERGRLPDRSFFVGVEFDDRLPSILSSSIAEMAPEPEIPKGVLTLQQLIEIGLARFTPENGSVRIEFGGMGRAIHEILRADLDGDGIEEILIFDYFYALEGTMGGGSLSILSRRIEDGLVAVSPWPEKAGPEMS